MIQAFNSLGSFAAHLHTTEADVKLTCDAAVVKESKIVAKTAKNMMVDEQPLVGYVGSDNPKGVWHEGETPRIPPRPFLSTAAASKIEGE